MFRDESLGESATTFWQSPTSPVAAVLRRAADTAFAANDEVGAVWHVYREIAQRIPRNAFTRHASTLGKAHR
jgi:hypothetical protein